MSNLEQFLLKRQQTGQSLTLVTGVFDVLHQEHRNFLVKAKATADLLLVGLESDARVRQMKGAGRPVNSQVERQANLREWGLADFIFVLPEQFSKPDDHRRLIGQIKPDFLAVSSHTSHQREKASILAQFGAKLLVVHDYNPAFSSSQIISGLQAQERKGDL
jgi:cytidyltransferase-like protein